MSYACTIPPYAGIFDEYKVSVKMQDVTFDGWTFSFDPDDDLEWPYGNGVGITTWHWKWSDTDSFHDEYTGFGTTAYRGAGKYTVTLKVTDNDETLSLNEGTSYAYVSEVASPFTKQYGPYWYWVEGPFFVPINHSFDICANSNPNSGSPNYSVFFPQYYPTWSITGPSNPDAMTLNSGYCYGGGEDQIIIYNVTVPGKYTVHAQAGPYDSGKDFDIYYFSAQLRDVEEPITYGSGTTFTYDIFPTSGWTPDDITLQIGYSDEPVYVKEVDLTEFGVGTGKTYVWDGKKENGEYASPGKYKAYLFINKGDAFYTCWTNEFIIKPYVSIGPDMVCVLINGDSTWDHDTCYATVQPSGGTFKWDFLEGEEGQINLTNTQSNPVNIELLKPSLYKRDIFIELEYIVNEVAAYDDALLTIITPIKENMIEGQLDDTHYTTPPYPYIQRYYYHQLIDQFDDVIGIEGIEVDEDVDSDLPAWFYTNNTGPGSTLSYPDYDGAWHGGIAARDRLYAPYGTVLVESQQQLSVGDVNIGPVYNITLDFSTDTAEKHSLP